MPTDFRFTGAPYLLNNAPFAEFIFDGRETVFFAPPPNRCRQWQSRWQPAEVLGRGLPSAFMQAVFIPRHRGASWGNSIAADGAGLSLPWGTVNGKQANYSVLYGQPLVQEATSSLRWQTSPPKEADHAAGWDDSAQPKQAVEIAPWNIPPAKDQNAVQPVASVDLYGSQQLQAGGYVHPQQPLAFIFAGNFYHPLLDGTVFFQFGQKATAARAVPVDLSAAFGFEANRRNDTVAILPWGFGEKIRDADIDSEYSGEDAPEPTEKPEPELPEIKEVYLMINTITAVVLPDRKPLAFTSMSITLDVDSFSWAFSGNLSGATALAQIEPTAEGTKEIEVTINEWTWRFLIEEYQQSRKFGSEEYSVTGVSRTQLLAAPYAPTYSLSNSAAINARQAISEALTNTGFEVEYPALNEFATPDWIISEGAFSFYNQTPMQVVASIAGTAGAVIIPDRALDKFSIQPRYPANVWQINEATMDKIIPASMTLGFSARWTPEPAYNAVYVSGTATGVAMNVRRAGTAGDLPAADIFEDMLTDSTVNRERGRNELNKGGPQSVVTIELPLNYPATAPGLVLPGQLVEYQDGSHRWRGYCLSCNIEVQSAAEVVQKIGIERHY